MKAHGSMGEGGGDDSGADADTPTFGRVWIGVAGMLVVIAVAAIAIWATGDESDDGATDATTTSALEGTSTIDAPTTSPPSTSTPPTTAPPTEGSNTAVWPWAVSPQRFDDPVAAARSYALDFVGFTNPVIGEFMQGDSRSGEIEVRPRPDGPVTTVFVRQVSDDDSWWVLGSATANIEVTEPSALSAIDSPVTLKGRANAFEGTVNVDVRVDGSMEPLAEGFVTGQMGEMGPFKSALEFPSPKGGRGAVLFRTLSAEDGSVWEAAVVRVGFVGAD
ncbi:MAG: Gmad2 immunoglobulin-like domain-containing protein [Microthrixaceae bacterium]|nr:Gmad2 immunoglobulin-like domain-containing protein [Microthrixaceae bacterium]